VAVLQHIVFNRHLKIEEEDAGAQTEVISAALCAHVLFLFCRWANHMVGMRYCRVCLLGSVYFQLSGPVG